jgi:hypothetical protein
VVDLIHAAFLLWGVDARKMPEMSKLREINGAEVRQLAAAISDREAQSNRTGSVAVRDSSLSARKRGDTLSY